MWVPSTVVNRIHRSSHYRLRQFTSILGNARMRKVRKEKEKEREKNAENDWKRTGM